MPRSPCAPDQPAERLRQPRADDPVVIGAAAAGQPPRRVEHRRPRPGHPLHHHQPQRFAGHVDAVAQRVGAEQRGVRIVAEDVDQRAGVDRIDMLGEQRQAGAGQPVGDAGVDRLQPLDRGEQAERAAARRLDQPRIGAGQRGDVARA